MKAIGSYLLIGVASAVAAAAFRADRIVEEVQPPAVCTIDSVALNFTFEHIAKALDPTRFALPEEAARRDSMGLSGVLASDATLVEDAAVCGRAREAFLTQSADGDSGLRAQLSAKMPSIILVRLSETRYLLNTGLDHPWTHYDFRLLDSLFNDLGYLFD